MHIIEMQLYNFFINQSYPYHQAEVEMCFNEKDGSITISSDVPGHEVQKGELTLTLHVGYENLFEFASAFILTSTNDVQKITSQLLHKMFLLGRCNLYCYLDNNLEIYLLFRRIRNGLVASNDEQKEFKVPNQINTIDEIIIYTEHYFEKLFA